MLHAIAGELTGVLPIHAPAGLGTYEAGIVAGLHFVGTAPAQALVPAVNLHLVLLATAFVGGIAGRPAHCTLIFPTSLAKWC